MKDRRIQVKLNEKAVNNYKQKYQSDEIFKIVNGSFYESYYKEYRAIQFQIVKHLCSKYGNGYDTKKVTINMDFVYEDESIKIVWSSWIPRIEISILKSKKNEHVHQTPYRIDLRDTPINKQMDFFLLGH